MNWRIGIASGTCIDQPILSALDAIEANGVLGVEFSTPQHHFAPWDAAQVDTVSARLRGSRLVPVSMHAPFGGRLDLSDGDPHRLQGTLHTVLTTAHALAKLGGHVLVAHATDVTRAGADVQAHLDRAATSLRILTQGCKNLGLTLAIESALPHLIAGHPDEFAWLLARVGPDARVCLDTGHLHLGGHWRRFVEIAGDRVVHIHAHDNRGQSDDHLPPGDGHIAWPEIRRSLDMINYAGWIMLELKCPETPLVEYYERAVTQTNRLLNDGRD